ncbi:uncharacterized protein G2W53_023542 [Senna tora]|uniref:Uncharacterized protein n=1 Tax=Senna tora TaxID=362788 RepID=A0A834TC00_9FABA|nr:uncharacterized protein G2W53_023542 [Senna tora]
MNVEKEEDDDDEGLGWFRILLVNEEGKRMGVLRPSLTAAATKMAAAKVKLLSKSSAMVQGSIIEGESGAITEKTKIEMERVNRFHAHASSQPDDRSGLVNNRHSPVIPKISHHTNPDKS